MADIVTTLQLAANEHCTGNNFSGENDGDKNKNCKTSKVKINDENRDSHNNEVWIQVKEYDNGKSFNDENDEEGKNTNGKNDKNATFFELHV